MATYGTYSDFIVRFPAVANDANAVNEVNSYFLPAASAWVEEQFGAHFVLPFSSNNTSIPEIVYERAYAQIMLRSWAKPEVAAALMKDLNSRIEGINSGGAALATTSGALFAQDLNPKTIAQIDDSNAGYNPVFTLDDPFYTRADPNLIVNDRSVRGFRPEDS